jgi:hypothetical protein
MEVSRYNRLHAGLIEKKLILCTTVGKINDNSPEFTLNAIPKFLNPQSYCLNSRTRVTGLNN